MSDKPKKLRCAIYTRKSTEDGLEQDFNSLDAQLEVWSGVRTPGKVNWPDWWEIEK